MKKKLPFEEAIEGKLHQSALPDKELAWQAMEELLNKKKKRRGAFYFKRLLAAAFLLAGIAAVYLFATKEERNKKTTATITKQGVKQNFNGQNIIHIDSTGSNNIYPSNKKAEENTPTDKAIIAGTGSNKTDNATINPSVKTKKSLRGKMKALFTSPIVEEEVLTMEQKNNSTVAALNKENSKNKDGADNTKENTSSGNSLDTDEAETKKITNPSVNDTLLKPSIENDNYKTDSSGRVSISTAATTNLDTIISKKQNAAAANPVSKQKATIQKYTWSAGLGLQQQIPVAGQKITTYGHGGRNRIIDDYVPSLYMRFQKKKQWYLQGEFSYGAPRSVAAFAYSRITKVNSNSNEISITTLTLKKTYYHELPLTFNYFITDKWSIGTGGMYGILHRTVSEKNTITKNLQNQQEITISSTIPSGYTDSFLYKTQWHYVLQSAYEWKRLAVGLRYSIDMQPYIKYTLPSGELYQRKNKTLDVLIRFRIF